MTLTCDLRTRVIYPRGHRKGLIVADDTLSLAVLTNLRLSFGFEVATATRSFSWRSLTKCHCQPRTVAPASPHDADGARFTQCQAVGSGGECTRGRLDTFPPEHPRQKISWESLLEFIGPLQFLWESGACLHHDPHDAATHTLERHPASPTRVPK